MTLPFWLRQCEPERATYDCPFCKTHWRYGGPLNRLRWQCPVCNTWLTWSETEQLELYRLRTCRACGGKMVKRDGRYGPFFGCDFYPDCEGKRWRWEWKLRPTVEIAISSVSDDRKEKQNHGYT